MRRKIGWFLIFLSLCFMGIAIGFYVGKAMMPPKINKAIVAKTPDTEVKLTNWVYSRSARISKDTAKEIVKECMKTEKPLLMLALIATESEFVPSSASNVGAAGLSQVMWPVHSKELIAAGIAKDRRDLFNIDASVKAGNVILGRFIKESDGDLNKALTKYQGGYNTYYIQRILSDLGTLYVLVGGK